MKGKRNMVYGNYEMGAFNEPNMINMPSGYNMTGHYTMYGPNPNMMPMMNNYSDEYEERFTKIERQINNLDLRLKKLESNIDTSEDSNLYML